MPTQPNYPIYVPSKGRYDACHTAQFLSEDGLLFYLVVEPAEKHHYQAAFPKATILELPHNDCGLIFSRNWIKKHATGNGHARHWQLDDNIRRCYRWYKKKILPVQSGIALTAVEQFVDQYENVAIAGLNYEMFCIQGSPPPYYLNCHVYSCSLILNSLPNTWRERYNDDTDMCLQVLADGWCTVLVNAFMADKIRTMVVKGGNTDDLYQDDGRCHMARALQRRWPYIVTTKRRFQRPQHVVRDAWRKFDTQLIRKKDAKPASVPDMKLVQVAEKIKSPAIREMMHEQARTT